MNNVSPKKLKSSDKFFSKKLFIQGLKNSSSMGILILVIFTVINGILAFNQAWDYTNPARSEIDGRNFLPLGNFIIILAPIIAYSTFSFLFKRVSSDFFHALPQKRICVFLSFVSSNVTWILIPLLASSIINLSIYGISGNFYFDPAEIIHVLFQLFTASLAVEGITLVMIFISGTSSQWFIYTFISYPSLVLLFDLYLSHIQEQNASIVFSHSVLAFIDFEFSPLYILVSGPSLNVWIPLLFFLESIILFLSAAFLYTKRDSQSAGNPHFYSRIHTAMIIVALSSYTFLITSELEFFSIFMVLGLLLYFLAELISYKSAKNAIKHVPFYLVAIVVSVSLVISSPIIGNIYMSLNPSADEIKEICISKDSENLYKYMDFDPESYRVFSESRYMDIWIDDKEAIDAVVRSLPQSADKNRGYSGTTHKCITKMKLKNGKIITRRLFFKEKDFVFVEAGINKKKSISILELPYEKLIFYPRYNTLHGGKVIVPQSNFASLFNQFKEEFYLLSPQKQAESVILSSRHVGIVFDVFFGTEYYNFALNKEYFPKTAEMFYRYSMNNNKSNAAMFISNIAKLKNTGNEITVQFHKADGRALGNSLTDLRIAHISTNFPYYDEFFDSLDVDKLSQASDTDSLYIIVVENPTRDIYMLNLSERQIELLNMMKY